MNYSKPTIIHGEATKVYACKQGACNGSDNTKNIKMDDLEKNKVLKVA